MTESFLILAEATEAALPVWQQDLIALLRDPWTWAYSLAALGIWLMLPRGRVRGRRLGMVFALAGLGLFGWLVPRMGDWATDGVFLILAAVTLISAVAAVTSRNPVYSAIWFAVVLLGTAGLFLFQGAQFLGVATVVVYAGAILVTFLFVLMLAQPEGHAFYDRISWEAFLSAATAGVMICMLTNQIMLATGGSTKGVAEETNEIALQEARQEELGENILAQQHVAHLGRQMFSEYLIAVEVGGVLLLAALVGAVAIVAQGKQTPTFEHEQESGRSGSHA